MNNLSPIFFTLLFSTVPCAILNSNDPEFDISVKNLLYDNLNGMYNISVIKCFDESILENVDKVLVFFSFRKPIGTKYCESIFNPTVCTLKRALSASFKNAKRDQNHLNETELLDLCCRTLHKCDTQSVQLQHTIERNFVYCECENLFRLCLKKLNTTASNKIVVFREKYSNLCRNGDLHESNSQQLQFTNSKTSSIGMF